MRVFCNTALRPTFDHTINDANPWGEDVPSGHLTWWNESDTQTSWQKEKQWDPQIYTSNCSQTSAKNQTTEVITVITLESCSTWFHVELLWNSCTGGTSSSFLDLSCNNWWMRACISETSNLRAVQTLRLVVNLEKYIDTLASLILQTSQDMKLSNGWANTSLSWWKTCILVFWQISCDLHRDMHNILTYFPACIPAFVPTNFILASTGSERKRHKI